MVIRNPEVLRSILEDERARLQAVIAESEPESGRNLGLGNHMADDATEAYEQAKELALHQNAARLLLQVEEALDRLEEGSYGRCENCDQTIDPARLEALPYATLCLHCQQRQSA